MPFRFWTFDHWLNFGIFLLGAVSAVGITAATHWSDVPHLFTPAVTIGFLISVLGFMRAQNTNAARNPALGTRSSDPWPTAPLVVTPTAAIPVPPATPGRPVDPSKEHP